MKQTYKTKFAFLFIIMLVTLPVYVSVSIAQTDGLLNANTVSTNNVNNNSLDDTNESNDLTTCEALLAARADPALIRSMCPDPTFPDPGDVAKQCIAKHEQASSLADLMDNDIIKILEQVASVMYMIYTTMTAVHTILSAVSQFFSLEGGCCAGLPFTAAACGSLDGAKNAWDGVYNSPMVAALGCFVSCGWCTGQGNCGGFFAKIPLFNQVPKVMGGARLSPYENIYTASACLCPTAILFNLRKLKTIYDTYDCCIQEACANGISTQSCERMLDEATCMYWKGSLYKMLVRVVIGMIAGFIQKMILNIVGKNLMLNCLLAAFDLAQIPSTIEGVQQGYKWVSVTFSEPNCKDLGFEEIIKQVQADKPIYKDVKIYDSNRDGRYDGFTTIVNGKDGEVHTTKTNYAERAIVRNRATLDGGSKLVKVDNVRGIETGYIVTIKAGTDPRHTEDRTFVVSDHQPGNSFSKPVTADDGRKYEFSDAQIAEGKVVVERLASNANPGEKRLYNGMKTAIHKHNEYEEKEKVQGSDYTGADLKKGEKVIVQKDSKYYVYSKDGSGDVKPQEVAVIKEYLVTKDYKANIDGKMTAINHIIKTDKGDYVIVKGQLYKETSQDSGKWEKSEDPEPLVVQGKTSDSVIRRIKDQEREQKREERAYKASWLLLDMTLGKYAYGKIDEMCKQEWESSED